MTQERINSQDKVKPQWMEFVDDFRSRGYRQLCNIWRDQQHRVDMFRQHQYFRGRSNLRVVFYKLIDLICICDKYLRIDTCRNQQRYWKRVQRQQYVMAEAGHLAIRGSFYKQEMIIGQSAHIADGCINIEIRYYLIPQASLSEL